MVRTDFDFNNNYLHKKLEKSQSHRTCAPAHFLSIASFSCNSCLLKLSLLLDIMASQLLRTSLRALSRPAFKAAVSATTPRVATPAVRAIPMIARPMATRFYSSGTGKRKTNNTSVYVVSHDLD